MSITKVILLLSILVFNSCVQDNVIYCDYEIAEPQNYIGDIWTENGKLSESSEFNFPYNGFQLQELEQTLLQMEEVNSVEVFLDPLNRRITIEIESSIMFEYVDFWGDESGVTTIVKPFSGGC